MKIEGLKIKIQEITEKNNTNPYGALIDLFNLANEVNDNEYYLNEYKKDLFKISKEEKLNNEFLKLSRTVNGMNRAKKGEMSSVFNTYVGNPMTPLTKLIEKKDKKMEEWIKNWVNSYIQSFNKILK